MYIEWPNHSIEAACERVLRSLPAWFGIESSLMEYVHDTSRYPTAVAQIDGEIVGFLTLHQHFEVSWELHCIAVRVDIRQQGVGRALLAEAEDYIRTRGGRFLQVKTLAASADSPEYAQTRAFYVHMGFVPLEVFPEFWSIDNPCLQMIKVLE